MNDSSKRNLTPRARQLRAELTGPEQKLWAVLRGRQLAGLKFRRQQPIGPFIVDYFCAERRLIVELDGRSHDETNVGYDRERQRWLESQGYRVLRIENDDVIQDLDSCCVAILHSCGLTEDGGLLDR